MQVHRATTFVACPDAAQNLRLFRLAGACRFIWTTLLAQNRFLHAGWRISANEKPSTAYEALTKELTQLRRKNDWLSQMPVAVLRSACKRLSLAWAAKLKRDAGFPKMKARHRATPGFDIVDNVRVESGRLWLGREAGWLRLNRRGENLYANWMPVKATLTHQRHSGAWQVTVTYRGEVALSPDDGTAVAVDRNVGQAVTSERLLYRLPDERLDRLTRKQKRWQSRAARQKGARKGEKCSNSRRRTLRRISQISRRKANIRRNWAHHVTADLAAHHHAVVMEDLNTRGMTRSVKGTKEKPGRRVKAKQGLNREILASAWGELERMAGYKSGRLVLVPAHHTSQTCRNCGFVAKESRKGRRYRCVSCGMEAHADLNAAMNILGRAVKLGLVNPPPTSLGGVRRVEPDTARDALFGRGRIVRLAAPRGGKRIRGGPEPPEPSSVSDAVA